MNCYRIFLLLLITALVGACGQPGPLYLPEEAPSPGAVQEQSQEAKPDTTETKTDQTLETPPVPAETQPAPDTEQTQ